MLRPNLAPNRRSFSSVAAACPESIASAPIPTPSFKSPAIPAATSARRRIQQHNIPPRPRMPVSTSNSSAALVSTSPPVNWFSIARGSPAISGVTRAAFQL